MIQPAFIRLHWTRATFASWYSRSLNPPHQVKRARKTIINLNWPWEKVCSAISDQNTWILQNDQPTEFGEVHSTRYHCCWKLLLRLQRRSNHAIPWNVLSVAAVAPPCAFDVPVRAWLSLVPIAVSFSPWLWHSEFLIRPDSVAFLFLWFRLLKAWKHWHKQL